MNNKGENKGLSRNIQVTLLSIVLIMIRWLADSESVLIILKLQIHVELLLQINYDLHTIRTALALCTPWIIRVKTLSLEKFFDLMIETINHEHCKCSASIFRRLLEIINGAKQDTRVNHFIVTL